MATSKRIARRLPVDRREFRRIQFHRVDAPIAGMQHHNGHKYWGQMDIGTPVYLFREPDNKHDSNAISVSVWDDDLQEYVKIGYVGRAIAMNLAKEIDRGFEVEAIITRRNPAADFYNQLTVSISLFAYLPVDTDAGA